MTARALLDKQIDDVTYQLTMVLEGVDEAHLDHKVVPTAMSIREQVEHLCEVYTALEEMSRGVSHEWGTYKVEDTSWPSLTALFKDLRAKAIVIVQTSDDEKTIMEGSGFIVNHDAYHVGQIALIRIAVDPSWNPYSIYNH
ncbi:MAG: DinB family protein [Fimbriimonas sp.]|nr:DinB family protein [Fimbriimonas sp.]